MGEASYKSDTLPSSEYSSERSVSSSSSSADTRRSGARGLHRLVGREEDGVGRRRGAGGRHQVHDHAVAASASILPRPASSFASQSEATVVATVPWGTVAYTLLGPRRYPSSLSGGSEYSTPILDPAWLRACAAQQN